MRDYPWRRQCEATESKQEFLNAEHLIELQSGELKKELRLGDLVLSQVLYIMAFTWLGPAGRLGPGCRVFIAWIPAVLLFYIPSGIVVLHLNREMPLEGGLYQWAKLRFGAAAGFLVALNLLATVVLVLASEPSQISNNLSYLAGTGGAWIIENRAFTMLFGAVLMGGLTLATLRGLALGRWFHNVGGAVLAILFVGMFLFAFPRGVDRSRAGHCKRTCSARVPGNVATQFEPAREDGVWRLLRIGRRIDFLGRMSRPGFEPHGPPLNLGGGTADSADSTLAEPPAF